MVAFNEDVIQGRVSQTALTQVLALEYSEMEERWLQNHFNTYDATFRSINIGWTLLKDCVGYSLDIPTSKNICAKLGQVFRERFIRIITQCDAFHSLNGTDQASLLRGNVLYCLTFFAVRVNSTNCGKDQIITMLGETDKAQLFENYASVMRRRPFKLVPISASCRHMPPEDLKTFAKLVKDLSEYALDEEKYLIVMHLLMFSDDYIAYSPMVKAMLNRFLTALHRRNVKAVGGNMRAAQLVTESFSKVVQDIRKLSAIVFKSMLTFH